MTPEKIKCVVLAICALHNCLLKLFSSYLIPSTCDKDNSTMTGTMPGEWRSDPNNIEKLQSLRPRYVEVEAIQNRNNYMVFLTTMVKCYGKMIC